MKHLNIHVQGKVQGVWFRASTRDEAQRLGIHGFVRNEADGGVYLEAEGDEAALDALITWLWQGPVHANVDKVTSEEGAINNFNGFEITQ